MFKPVYDNSVFIVRDADPNSRPPVNVSAQYCLMPSSAKLLALLFTESQPRVYEDKPWPSYGPFSFNHLVPWLEFPNGRRFNAGLLASWWGIVSNTGDVISMPGVSYKDAMAFAMKDVNDTW